MSTGNFPSDFLLHLREYARMELTRENLLNLIRSELDSRKLSVAGLERDALVPKDTVRDFLRGKTQILRADKLQKILRIIGREGKILLSAYVSDGAEIISLPKNVKEEVELPVGFDASNIKAIKIKTDAMLPVFYQDWIIYYSNFTQTQVVRVGAEIPYSPKDENNKFSEFLGRPCVIKLADNKIYLRTLKQASQPDLYDLIGYNVADIKNAKVADVAKIVFIKT